RGPAGRGQRRPGRAAGRQQRAVGRHRPDPLVAGPGLVRRLAVLLGPGLHSRGTGPGPAEAVAAAAGMAHRPGLLLPGACAGAVRADPGDGLDHAPGRPGRLARPAGSGAFAAGLAAVPAGGVLRRPGPGAAAPGLPPPALALALPCRAPQQPAHGLAGRFAHASAGGGADPWLRAAATAGAGL